MIDDAYVRYVRINLPHARTIVQRIAHALEVLGAFREGENGGAIALSAAVEKLEKEVRPFDEDPAMVGQALLLLGAIHNVQIPEEDEILTAIEDERARQVNETGDEQGPSGGPDREGGNYVM